MGDEPVTGRLLTVNPDHVGPCTWCTSTLTFHRPEGARQLAGTQLYKARWWTAPPRVGEPRSPAAGGTAGQR
ncbi:hypothetical protein ACFQ0M_43480 [Kitasatospora aburaviensis]